MPAQKAITLRPLASQANLSNGSLSKMRTGEVSSSVSTRSTFTKVLKAEINESFNGQNEYSSITLVRKSEQCHFIE